MKKIYKVRRPYSRTVIDAECASVAALIKANWDLFPDVPSQKLNLIAAEIDDAIKNGQRYFGGSFFLEHGLGACPAQIECVCHKNRGVVGRVNYPPRWA
ncbi:MAG: hypothetical protein LBS40_04245 [Burkholderiales bacterium]|jgi:hypothetical protein|nr:hypothetical protein [Burkholderiales bacterium]